MNLPRPCFVLSSFLTSSSTAAAIPSNNFEVIFDHTGWRKFTFLSPTLMNHKFYALVSRQSWKSISEDQLRLTFGHEDVSWDTDNLFILYDNFVNISLIFRCAYNICIASMAINFVKEASLFFLDGEGS